MLLMEIGISDHGKQPLEELYRSAFPLKNQNLDGSKGKVE